MVYSRMKRRGRKKRVQQGRKVGSRKGRKRKSNKVFVSIVMVKKVTVTVKKTPHYDILDKIEPISKGIGGKKIVFKYYRYRITGDSLFFTQKLKIILLDKQNRRIKKRRIPRVISQEINLKRVDEEESKSVGSKEKEEEEEGEEDVEEEEREDEGDEPENVIPEPFIDDTLRNHYGEFSQFPKEIRFECPQEIQEMRQNSFVLWLRGFEKSMKRKEYLKDIQKYNYNTKRIFLHFRIIGGDFYEKIFFPFLYEEWRVRSKVKETLSPVRRQSFDLTQRQPSSPTKVYHIKNWFRFFSLIGMIDVDTFVAFLDHFHKTKPIEEFQILSQDWITRCVGLKEQLFYRLCSEFEFYKELFNPVKLSSKTSMLRTGQSYMIKLTSIHNKNISPSKKRKKKRKNSKKKKKKNTPTKQQHQQQQRIEYVSKMGMIHQVKFDKFLIGFMLQQGPSSPNISRYQRDVIYMYTRLKVLHVKKKSKNSKKNFAFSYASFSKLFHVLGYKILTIHSLDVKFEDKNLKKKMILPGRETSKRGEMMRSTTEICKHIPVVPLSHGSLFVLNCQEEEIRLLEKTHRKQMKEFLNVVKFSLKSKKLNQMLLEQRKKELRDQDLEIRKMKRLIELGKKNMKRQNL